MIPAGPPNAVTAGVEYTRQRLAGTLTWNRGRFGWDTFGGKGQDTGWFVGTRAKWSF